MKLGFLYEGRGALIHLHVQRGGRRVSILATDAARASSAIVVNSEEEDRGKLGWASL